jgi:predicted transcriptional regulator
MQISLIDRIGLKLLEHPLTVEDITNLVNYGSAGCTRGEVRVEINHLLASHMVTAKVIHNKDTYSLTKIGRRWADGAREGLK